MMRKESKKKSMKKFILEKIKPISIISIVLLLIFPTVLCTVLKLLTKYVPGDWLVVTEEISSWFSFIASYSGVIGSIVIGLITLYLTVLLANYNEENQKLETRISIATNMPNMVCDDMMLFSLSEADFPLGHIKLFDDKSDFILTFKMKPAFPPYFNIEMKSMKIRMKNLRTGIEMESEVVDITAEDYQISNNETFDAIINVPKKLDVQMQNLYVLNLLTSSGTEYEKKIVDLWIYFVCSNVLLENQETDVKFRMHFRVENMGKTNDNGVRLEIINRQFERIK